jgi:endo-1,4-beta-xylanase
VGRYKGRIKGWDVVNEALAEDGSLRQTQWLKIIGDDYLIKAFQFAHEADPAVELYYNDYSLENDAKRHGAMALVKRLLAADVHITGIGSQTHLHIDSPATQKVDETLTELGQLGVKVMITELDVNVLPSADASNSADVSLRVTENPALNPYRDGLPQAMQQKLAQRYADLFAVFVKHRDVIERVTLWGVTDAGSWLNNWPVRGRTNYPLLFDRSGQPKLAFSRVIETASAKK